MGCGALRPRARRLRGARWGHKNEGKNLRFIGQKRANREEKASEQELLNAPLEPPIHGWKKRPRGGEVGELSHIFLGGQALHRAKE